MREQLAAANGATISAGCGLELQLVLAGRRAAEESDQVDALFKAYEVATRPFDEVQLRIAREAAVRFGKGRHRAAVNCGDCFAYAFAKSEGLPLLCKGGEFKQTDLELV